VPVFRRGLVSTAAAFFMMGAAISWVARSGTTRQRDVFVARADGSNVRNLSANPADDYDVDWSPDGTMLAFASTRAGGTRLFVYDFDNGRLWPISDSGTEAHPVFSPDGRSIAGQIGKIAAEVWALENFLPAPPAKK